MFLVPDGSTTAEAWQGPTSQKLIVGGMEQLFGYMKHNNLLYGLLTTGELFVFMQRQGNSLKVADVRRTSNQSTPMAAIYYLM